MSFLTFIRVSINNMFFIRGDEVELNFKKLNFLQVMYNYLV